MRYIHIRTFALKCHLWARTRNLDPCGPDHYQTHKMLWRNPGAPTDWISRWVSVLTVGQSSQVRSPRRADYALVNVEMHYMHMRTFALKLTHVGIEPATLTHAAQTITQLTKWTGGGTFFHQVFAEFRQAPPSFHQVPTKFHVSPSFTKFHHFFTIFTKFHQVSPFFSKFHQVSPFSPFSPFTLFGVLEMAGGDHRPVLSQQNAAAGSC